jgi:hypothetical protein
VLIDSCTTHDQAKEPRAMQAVPEGTDQPTGARRPRWLVVVGVLFLLYLGFRLVEGVIWLIGRF